MTAVLAATPYLLVVAGVVFAWQVHRLLNPVAPPSGGTATVLSEPHGSPDVHITISEWGVCATPQTGETT